MENICNVRCIVIILTLTVMCIIINNFFDDVYPKSIERYKANNINNTDVDFLDIITDNNFSLQTHRNIVHRLNSSEFIDIVEQINVIISDKIIAYTKLCQGMNGDDALLPNEKYSLNLACHIDAWSIEEDIVKDITKYIIKYIKIKFNMNLNPYHIIHDLMRHLNLLEAIIYPLKYSGLYTVHGIQYTNEKYIRQKVDTHLDIKDVLYTTLTRRDIILFMDTDQQIQ
jgi:hypothetical protein